MDKSRILLRNSVHSVMNERNLLSLIKHPFIVNMHFAYQDRSKLYLILDLMAGGDLRYHLGRIKQFNENQTRFLVCCLLLSIEYLHENNIIHRDIKPENIVLDCNGYAHLTDFGIARILQKENKHETSGTPGYMSPEVICRQNHSKETDFFAIGVIVFEFMTGKRPYLGKNRKEIRDAILLKQVKITQSTLPPDWSPEAGDFANQLLQRKPQNRLGRNGIGEVKEHPWVKNVNWSGLMQRKLLAPFVPLAKDNFDSKHVNSGWVNGDDKFDLELASIQNLFQGYSFESNKQKDPSSAFLTTEAVVRKFNTYKV